MLRSNPTVIKMLKEHGAKVVTTTRKLARALQEIIQSQVDIASTEMLQLLLMARAEDAANSLEVCDINAANDKGETLLHQCLRYKLESSIKEAVELLKANGAIVNPTYENLKVAAIGNYMNPEIVREIFRAAKLAPSKPFDINSLDENENTILDRAMNIWTEDKETLSQIRAMIRSNGAKVTVTSEKLFEVTARSYDYEQLQFLLEDGGSVNTLYEGKPLLEELLSIVSYLSKSSIGSPILMMYEDINKANGQDAMDIHLPYIKTLTVLLKAPGLNAILSYKCLDQSLALFCSILATQEFLVPNINFTDVPKDDMAMGLIRGLIDKNARNIQEVHEILDRDCASCTSQNVPDVIFLTIWSYYGGRSYNSAQSSGAALASTATESAAAAGFVPTMDADDSVDSLGNLDGGLGDQC
jgi:hypothetical protein